MQPNTSLLTDRSFTENPELTGTYLALGRQLAGGGGEAPPGTLALAGRLRGILVDSASEVARAQGKPIDINVLKSRSGSGVPIAERITLAERTAGEPPTESAVVVWLAYASAHLHSPFHLQLGQSIS